MDDTSRLTGAALVGFRGPRCLHRPAAFVFLGAVLLAGPASRPEDPPPADLASLFPEALLLLAEGSSPALSARAGAALIQRGAASAPVLREAALEGGEERRLIALRLLCEMRDGRAASIAISNLHHPSTRVGKRAASIILTLRPPTAYEPLLGTLLRARDPGLKKSVIAALGALGEAKAIPVLRPYLSGEDAGVAVNAAIALARLGSEEGLETLLASLKGPDLGVRREATYGLGYFSSPRALAAAETIVSAPDGAWKSEARIAIALRRLAALNRSGRQGVLRELSSDADPAVRKWAARELADSAFEPPRAGEEVAR